MEKYIFTVQLTGRGDGPMEAWENAIENFKDDPLEYEDVDDFFTEESEERDPDIVYYRPKLHLDGAVLGHENVYLFPFEVWKSKNNLIKQLPHCKIEEVKHKDIELPIFADE